MFPMTPDTRERATLQFAREGLFPNVREDPLIAHFDTRDLLLQRMPRKVPRVTFDLGELGHGQ
jgi:hypothetical protein